MLKTKPTVLSAYVLSGLLLVACGGSSNSTQTQKNQNTTYQSNHYLAPVQGVLSEKTTVTGVLKKFFNGFIGNAYADFPSALNNAWTNNLATRENSDSLMGFINQNITPILTALESANWDYDKTGAGTLNITIENTALSIPYYSKTIAMNEGVGATIYLGFNTEQNFKDFNYRSNTSIPTPSLSGFGNTVLTLKETDDTLTFHWVEMSKYASESNAQWQLEQSYVKYKQDANSTEKTFPAINRSANSASGGRAVLFHYDKQKGELYFEHLTSSEKHNRQEHYSIRLTGVNNASGTYKFSHINYNRVARQYFSTDINGTQVNLVNDANDNTKLTWDIMQGAMHSGLVYKHKSDQESFTKCIKFTEALNPETVTDANCASTDLALPTLTSNFTSYMENPTTYAYLPSAGSDYNGIDLRINLHALYTPSYTPTWIGSLPTTN